MPEVSYHFILTARYAVCHKQPVGALIGRPQVKEQTLLQIKIIKCGKVVSEHA